MLESVRGLACVKEIARATTRLEALMFGAADMSADLGAETAWELLLYTRSRLVAACALLACLRWTRRFSMCMTVKD
jgi:(S)-citramalyl-CoA lyase